MQAFVLSAHDEAPHIADLPDPEVGADLPAGARVVPVLAAGLNPVDIALATPPSAQGPFPRVLGAEGVVSLDGRLCYVETALIPHGTFAPLTVIDPAEAIVLPEGISPAEAVPLGIAGLAGWIPIETTGAMRAGETVLVLGATGAVGQAAAQAARLLGAGRVVAVGRNEAKLQALVDRGVADESVTLGSDDDAAAMRDATKGGADLILDALYAAPLADALRYSRPGARCVTVGNRAGNVLTLPLMSIFGKSLLTYSNGSVDLELKRSAFTRMAQLVASGDFWIEHQTCSLSEVAEAWQSQLNRSSTKFVITM